MATKASRSRRQNPKPTSTRRRTPEVGRRATTTRRRSVARGLARPARPRRTKGASTRRKAGARRKARGTSTRPKTATRRTQSRRPSRPSLKRAEALGQARGRAKKNEYEQDFEFGDAQPSRGVAGESGERLHRDQGGGRKRSMRGTGYTNVSDYGEGETQPPY